MVGRLERELTADPALVRTILEHPDVFPPVQTEPKRIIRCRQETLGRAIARAIARALARVVVRREWWLVKVEGAQL